MLEGFPWPRWNFLHWHPGGAVRRPAWDEKAPSRPRGSCGVWNQPPALCHAVWRKTMRKLAVFAGLTNLASSLNGFIWRTGVKLTVCWPCLFLLHLEAVSASTLRDTLCVAIFVVIPCDAHNSNFCSLYCSLYRFRCKKQTSHLTTLTLIA